jgi:RHS repeat-associated protein
MAVEGGSVQNGSCPNGVTWCEAYGYDQPGNRWVADWRGVSPLGVTPRTSSWFNGNNQISDGASYDAVGNQTRALGQSASLAYDAESRMIGAALDSLPGTFTFTYGYDGDGRRVSRSLYGMTSTYLYDAFGTMVSEYRNNAWLKDFIYLDGRLLVVEDAVQETSYVTPDQLGSTRIVTNASGGVISRHDYLPFGEEVPVNLGGRFSVPGYAEPGTASTTDQPIDERVLQRFTGQERDAETGLDNFLARYMSSAQGRFMSPDPLGMFAADPFNPQSWNLYAYVLNNPLALTDPTGTDCAYLNGAGTAILNVDTNSSASKCSSTGGYYVSGQVNTLTVDGNGNYHFAYNSVDANGTFQTQVYDSYVPPNKTDPQADVPIYGLGGQGAQILKAAGDRASRDLKTSAIMMGVFAGSYATVAYGAAYAVPALAAAAATGGGKFFQIVQDETGKVHGDLPTVIPKDIGRAELEFAAQELKASIEIRLRDLANLGEQGNHGLRVAEEQNLLYRIQQRLGQR